MKITKPTVLLNWEIAEANLLRMIRKASLHELVFRPHLKTPQSQSIARRYRALGINAITVSSFSMAEYFAADGWNDITVAFPVNVREIDTIHSLARKIRLNLLISDTDGLSVLSRELKAPVGIFIKIDVGSHRTGFSFLDHDLLNVCLQRLRQSSFMEFKGFLAHAGHSYAARSGEEILKVHNETTAILKGLKELYAPHFHPLTLSTGDTPTCSVAENWKGIDEIRPGNFIFYDLMQVQIGACEMKDIAVVLACPVVARHPERSEVVIYGGGVHLSKDRLLVNKGEWGIPTDNTTIYGIPVQLTENGWKLPEGGSYVRSLSQEHGVIKCTPFLFDQLQVGSLAGILPVHSCMTVDLSDGYLTTKGEYWKKM